MNEELMFTEEEKRLLQNRQFFMVKQQVGLKLHSLFGRVNESLTDVISAYKQILPEKVSTSTGKISRGENYLGFPWMLLDRPRVFGKEDVFAFRSLCWWGNEFSFTLHLSGSYLVLIKKTEEKLQCLKQKELYICTSDSPWNYHFNSDNYIYLDDCTNEDINKLMAKSFLKLSRKLDIKRIDEVHESSINTFETLLKGLF